MKSGWWAVRPDFNRSKPYCKIPRRVKTSLGPENLTRLCALLPASTPHVPRGEKSAGWRVFDTAGALRGSPGVPESHGAAPTIMHRQEWDRNGGRRALGAQHGTRARSTTRPASSVGSGRWRRSKVSEPRVGAALASSSPHHLTAKSSSDCSPGRERASLELSDRYTAIQRRASSLGSVVSLSAHV